MGRTSVHADTWNYGAAEVRENVPQWSDERNPSLHYLLDQTSHIITHTHTHTLISVSALLHNMTEAWNYLPRLPTSMDFIVISLRILTIQTDRKTLESIWAPTRRASPEPRFLLHFIAFRLRQDPGTGLWTWASGTNSAAFSLPLDGKHLSNVKNLGAFFLTTTCNQTLKLKMLTGLIFLPNFPRIRKI